MMKIAACLAAACALAGRPRRRSSVGTKRRPTTKAPLVAPPTFVAATICRAQETNEDAFSPLAVPERCRGAEAATRPWFKHVGLDTLFPGAGLGEVFDESSEFRAALRRAAREDRCDESSPVRFDMTSSAQGSWFSRRPAAATHGVLRAALGASAPTGDEFYAKIGGLTLDGVAPRTGHFIDIVGGPGSRRLARYAWHQDRGGDTEAVTVMLGFPAASRQRGCGVFSHVSPLSHLVVHEADAEGDNSRPREFSDERGERRFLDVDAIPEASIVRPGYGRGRELIVYSDARVVHSAPDAIHRESLWRFM